MMESSKSPVSLETSETHLEATEGAFGVGIEVPLPEEASTSNGQCHQVR